MLYCIQLAEGVGVVSSTLAELSIDKKINTYMIINKKEVWEKSNTH